MGFRPTHEGKITVLAAFGKHTELVDKFNDLWKYKNDTLRFPFENLEKVKNLRIDDELSYSEKINFTNASGGISNDYSKRNHIIYKWLKINTNGFTKEDIAYACQKTAENIAMKLKGLLRNISLMMFQFH